MSTEQTNNLFQYVKAIDRTPKSGHTGYLALRIGGEPYRGWYDEGNFYVTVGTPIKPEYVEWAEPVTDENNELKEQKTELISGLLELRKYQTESNMIEFINMLIEKHHGNKTNHYKP